MYKTFSCIMYTDTVSKLSVGSVYYGAIFVIEYVGNKSAALDYW